MDRWSPEVLVMEYLWTGKRCAIPFLYIKLLHFFVILLKMLSLCLMLHLVVILTPAYHLCR